MFDPLFARAGLLWSAIIDLIQTTPALASSLESYTAQQIARHPQLDPGQRKLLVHRFAIEGEVDGKTPLDLFLASRSDLSLEDRQLVSSWRRSFVGLVAIVQIFPNGLEVMNWLTARHYRIQFSDEAAQAAMNRLKVGEVIIAQLSPIVDIDWAILTPWVSLGRLGRPKLAVAIGTFRQNYPHYLYCDAPEALAAAWESVAVYHDRFVEFFGSDEVTLTGHQLQARIGEFQNWMVEKQLAAAGIDSSKSLADLASDAGVSAEDLQAMTETLGADNSEAAKGQKTSLEKMVSPKVELPAHLKSAAAVTAMSHPYWGQMFLADYPQLQTLLTPIETHYSLTDLNFIRKCLTNPQMNAFVWRRLAERYPQQLQQAIGQMFDLPNFNLTADLDSILTKFNKYLEPDLPDIASVPVHLHELFQSAVSEVSKDKAKPKSQPKKTGFGAKN
ncbi:hypothetical protein [Chamaesiphon polymorphus]|uniref:Uncharacterized protein n=1 Tax=Chamaesiphon polymorphus CCALA 037 TaxID=2107692 RepID=A0A2T1FI86_9CYAN|nr:hypothetical protein [Chamaesiphon polymorphus]PSB44706.1 hypothetical protein C7B77_25550 [Chamaesiphon polymorphus CCALA 037]